MKTLIASLPLLAALRLARCGVAGWRRMAIAIVVGAALGSAGVGLAQERCVPEIRWQHSFAARTSDGLYQVKRLPDGGFLLGGTLAPPPLAGRMATNIGGSDVWLVRLDSGGRRLWEKSFGSRDDDWLAGIVVTADGGCILAVQSQPTTFWYSLWVIRVGSGGQELWRQVLGVGPSEWLSAPPVLTADSGCVLAWASESGPGSHGSTDYRVINLDAAGGIVWDHTFGGSASDSPSTVLPTADGGYLIAGQSLSPASGNKTSPNFGIFDVWLVRLNSTGDLLWEKTLGGSEYDAISFDGVRQTADGGFLLAAQSMSPVSGNKTSTNYGGFDVWIVRTDANGEILWDKTFGGTGDDSGPVIHPTSAGGFMVLCYSDSTNGNKTAPSYGGTDAWIFRLDDAGNKVWEDSFGGSGADYFGQFLPTPDGGFLLAGHSDSGADGNKSSPGYGGFDAWLVRLAPDGRKLWENSYGGSGHEYLGGVLVEPDDSFLMLCRSQSGKSGNKTTALLGTQDSWLVRLSTDQVPRFEATTLSFTRHGFRLFLCGLSNHVYLTEYSTNLLDWLPLQINQLTAPRVGIVDFGATNSPRRSYRARCLE